MTDKKTFERLVHSTTHPFMHWRELLAVFAASYLFLARMVYGVAYRIPLAVKQELVAAALLLPFACSGLRWDVEISAHK